jgi:hypothetical protein
VPANATMGRVGTTATVAEGLRRRAAEASADPLPTEASAALFSLDHKLNDFYWVHDEEPHKSRRLAMLKAHPELYKLMRHEPLTKWIVCGEVLVQFALAWWLSSTGRDWRTWEFWVLACGCSEGRKGGEVGSMEGENMRIVMAHYDLEGTKDGPWIVAERDVAIAIRSALTCFCCFSASILPSFQLMGFNSAAWLRLLCFGRLFCCGNHFSGLLGLKSLCAPFEMPFLASFHSSFVAYADVLFPQILSAAPSPLPSFSLSTKSPTTSPSTASPPTY